MKRYFSNITRLLVLAALPFVLTQCRDEEEIRFETKDATEAVNFRVIRSQAQFDASDPNAQVELTYYTLNTNISKVEVLAEYYSLLNDETSDRFLLEEITSGFSNDGSHKNVVTLEELKGAVGVSDLAGGDQLTIYHVVHLNDGRKYPDTVMVGTTPFVNVESGVLQVTTSSFTPVLNFPISCQIEDPAFATGQYLFEVVSGNGSDFGPLYNSGVVVDVEATNGTVRKFSIRYLPEAGTFTSTITFEFACNVVLVGAQSMGVGCGGPSLSVVQNPGDIGTFDAADDSQFTIGVLHNINDACGLPINQPVKFRLTKQ